MTFSSTIDLTGVANDGSDIIYVAGTSGERHLFRITSFTGGVSTCTGLSLADAIGASGLSASAWGIGGKRQTLSADSSNQDLQDQSEGWRFELEGTGSTYTLTGTNTLTSTHAVGGFLTNGPQELIAAAGATPKITWTGDVEAINLPTGSMLKISGIAFENTTSVSNSASAVVAAAGSSYVDIDNCSFVASGRFVTGAASVYGKIISCDIKSTYNQGLWLRARSSVLIADCNIHECGVAGSSSNGKGIYIQNSNGLCGLTIVSNRVWGCYATGIEVVDQYISHNVVIQNNVLDNNGSHGVYFIGTLADSWRCQCFNNIFTRNGGYGMSMSSSSGADLALWNDYNAYGAGSFANTSGQTQNITVGPHSVTLGSSVDPYVDSTNHDYRLNNTAGGGAACFKAGFGYGA